MYNNNLFYLEDEERVLCRLDLTLLVKSSIVALLDLVEEERVAEGIILEFLFPDPFRETLLGGS